MITTIGALICLSGNLGEQLNGLAVLSNASVLYDYHLVNMRVAPPHCFDKGTLTNSAVRKMLLYEKDLTWDWVGKNGRVLTVTTLGECEPKLGAVAPTPPCLPVSLNIYAGGRKWYE